jgi:uncharacterized membrane protein YeiB
MSWAWGAAAAGDDLRRATNRSWIPDAANLQYEQFWKLKGGTEAISNRADMLGDNLLALGAQYGWQLAGMMLMGASLMRTGWLKGNSACATIVVRGRAGAARRAD